MFFPASNRAIWPCDITRSDTPPTIVDWQQCFNTDPPWASCHHSMLLLIRWSRMASKWCSVLGFNNKHSSHFDVPKSEPLKTQWLSFVFKGNIPRDQCQCFYICANHFSPDCFINEGQYKAAEKTNQDQLFMSLLHLQKKWV